MRYNIDYSKYDLTDPNITAEYICRQEGISRTGLYYQFKILNIKLGHRGHSDKSKKAMFGKVSRKRLNNPFLFTINRFYKKWKSGAESRKKDFNLSIEDILELINKQNNKCALSGLPLYKEGKYNMSLDRIDSSRMYEKDNVQLTLKEVNYMKQDMPQEYFISLCKTITKNNI